MTRQSGKSRRVVRQIAICGSLSRVFHALGGIAVKHDPVSRAKYEALRKKGHGYNRSVRTVCNRLLSVACAILEKRELFDKEFKNPLQDVAA